MRILFSILTSFFLFGCASSPSQKKSPTLMEQASAPQPQMNVVGYTLEKMSSFKACPKVVNKTASIDDDMKVGAACTRAGQWHLVEELGNQMAIQFSNQPWGAYFLSLSAEHNKDWPRARWMIELATKKSPNEGLMLYQLGRVQWAMGEHMAALENLKKASEKNSSLVEAHVLMGQIAMLDQKRSDAERSFSRAYEHDAKNLIALMGLADVYEQEKKWTDAEKYLREAISAHPKYLEARLQLAHGLEAFAQDMAGALDVYKDIQKLERKKELDASPTFDLNAKVQSLQASVAEQLKKKMTERQPSAAQEKVSK